MHFHILKIEERESRKTWQFSKILATLVSYAKIFKDKSLKKVGILYNFKCTPNV